MVPASHLAADAMTQPEPCNHRRASMTDFKNLLQPELRPDVWRLAVILGHFAHQVGWINTRIILSQPQPARRKSASRHCGCRAGEVAQDYMHEHNSRNEQRGPRPSVHLNNFSNHSHMDGSPDPRNERLRCHLEAASRWPCWATAAQTSSAPPASGPGARPPSSELRLRPPKVPEIRVL